MCERCVQDGTMTKEEAQERRTLLNKVFGLTDESAVESSQGTMDTAMANLLLFHQSSIDALGANYDPDDPDSIMAFAEMHAGELLYKLDGRQIAFALAVVTGRYARVLKAASRPYTSSGKSADVSDMVRDILAEVADDNAPSATTPDRPGHMPGMYL